MGSPRRLASFIARNDLKLLVSLKLDNHNGQHQSMPRVPRAGFALTRLTFCELKYLQPVACRPAAERSDLQLRSMNHDRWTIVIAQSYFGKCYTMLTISSNIFK
jgi:hypothetical protein